MIASSTEQFPNQVATRLPLAQAVLGMFHWVLKPEFLEEVFQQYRGRSYQGEISFSLFVDLIADALLEHQGSGRQSFQRSRENGELTASQEAAYGKLRRIPLSLSMGLLSEASTRLLELFPSRIAGRKVPSSLAGMEIFFHDGKTLKHVSKRLKSLKKYKGKVLGGRLVVTQSFSTGLIVAMGAHEDGESGEQPLVPDALAQTRAAFPDACRLHVADRQYCDLVQMQRFAEAGDHFLLRWNRKLSFTRDESRPVQTGQDRYGRRYTEDWGWVGAEGHPQRRYVRRLHLHREGSKEDVILLTDLLDAACYSADDLLETYLHRWGIECTFQQVTEVFHLKQLIGSTPRATVFQAAFCFLLYNQIQVVRAYLAEGNDREVETISTEQVFQDVHRQMISWSELLEPQQTVGFFSQQIAWNCEQVRDQLGELLHGQWSDRWLKSPSNTHREFPERTIYPKGGHISVYRVMQKTKNNT